MTRTSSSRATRFPSVAAAAAAATATAAAATATAAAGMLLLGCSDKGLGDENPALVDDAPTWHQDVAPLVTEHCSGCHNDADDFTFSLTDHQTAQALAPWMLTKMLGDESSPPYIMPPFGAQDTEECEPPAPWKGDRRVPQADLDLFTAWVAAGAPAGDPGSAAPLVPRGPAQLTGDGIGVFRTAGVTLEEDEYEDLYRCFPIELGNVSETWITGIDVRPGNADIAHHGVVFTDPLGQGPAKVDETGSYPCFGGAKVSDSAVLFAWAPGADPLDLGGDIGVSVPAGGQLVVQMHYHPTGEIESDITALAVRMTDHPPSKTASMEVFGGVLTDQDASTRWEDPPFAIPAGEANHVETWVEELDVPDGVDVRVYAVFPHMHLAGTDIKMSIERDGEEICLMHNPSWDFEWQLTYMYDGAFDELPQVLPGDRIRVRCTFNNTSQNPILSEYMESTADIGLGEDTFDEMCVGFLGVAY